MRLRPVAALPAASGSRLLARQAGPASTRIKISVHGYKKTQSARRGSQFTRAAHPVGLPPQARPPRRTSPPD